MTPKVACSRRVELAAGTCSSTASNRCIPPLHRLRSTLMLAEADTQYADMQQFHTEADTQCADIQQFRTEVDVEAVLR